MREMKITRDSGSGRTDGGEGGGGGSVDWDKQRLKCKTRGRRRKEPLECKKDEKADKGGYKGQYEEERRKG